MKTVLVAVDPGASGAVAVRCPDGKIFVVPFSDESSARDLFEATAEAAEAEGNEILVFIEKVGGFVGGRGNPGNAMFNFGRNFGFYLGLCAAMRLRTELVSPNVWQKAFPTRAKSSEDKIAHKRELKEHAARLFPKIKVTLINADALLILEWAIRSRSHA